MSFRIIQLENLDISVEHYKDNLKFSFFDAYVKKTMEDAEQKTLWHQDGEIIFKNYDYDIDKKDFNNKEKIITFQVSFDFYTYKNMLVLPFSKIGDINIELRLLNIENIINIRCSELNLVEKENPRYIKHINKAE
tara:strand:+ start:1719 stop:2123 length:405 start_codon:yes stop_codon:yes gene_type:complete